MQRILVMGPSGSGKSTLARQLGDLLGIEVVHMDRLHWRPGWVEGPNDELRAAVAEAVRRRAWVIDGNYGGSGTLEERLEACDTIVYLDFPRRVCLWRVFRRIVRYHGQTRPDLADDCPEKFDWEFVKWVWDTPKRRSRSLARIAPYRDRRRVLFLRNSREVRKFLTSVPTPTTAAAAISAAERVAVIGPGGSGKSQFAATLSAILATPSVHMDDLLMDGRRAGDGVLRGREVPMPVQRAIMAEAVIGPRWLIEGGYWRTLDILLGAAELVVFLDPPPLEWLGQMTRREAAEFRWWLRNDRTWQQLWLQARFLIWQPWYLIRERRRVLGALDNLDRSTVVHLRGRAAVRRFLAGERLAYSDANPPRGRGE